MRLWRPLLGLALATLGVAASFWVGFGLGQVRCAAPAAPDCPRAAAPDPEGAADRARLQRLGTEVTALRQEGSILERTLQIEREASRSLQDQLKEAQGERLALVKELTYLERLIQQDGKLTLRVHDLRLIGPTEAGRRSYRYAFAVTQLVPGLGRSSGQVRVRVEGRQGARQTALGLEELPRAEPRRLAMGFEHYQRFEGGFDLPAGFQPSALAVTVDPDGEALAESAERFPWLPTPPATPGPDGDAPVRP